MRRLADNTKLSPEVVVPVHTPISSPEVTARLSTLPTLDAGIFCHCCAQLMGEMVPPEAEMSGRDPAICTFTGPPGDWMSSV